MIFGLVWASIVATLAAIISFGLGRLPRPLTAVSRGVGAGLTAGFLPVAIVWLIDAFTTAEPDWDVGQTFLMGAVLFGLLVGFPVAFAVAKLQDKRRPAPIDPKVFE